MDVFTRKAAVQPLQNKNAETVGRATKRAAKEIISVPSLHRAVPVRFFHFAPAKSLEA